MCRVKPRTPVEDILIVKISVPTRIKQENEWEISDHQLAFILDEEKNLAGLGLHENTIINLAFSGGDDSWIKKN